MYFQTKEHFLQFEDEKLSQFLNQIQFKINSFGKWESKVDKKASYSSDDFELIYYVKGGSHTTIGSKKYECHPHSILILEPYTLNHSINEGYDEYVYYYIHFDIQPSHLIQQFSSLLTSHGHMILENEIRDFQEMFDRLYEESQRKEIGYATVIVSGLIRLLVYIMRVQQKRQKDTYVIEDINRRSVKIVEEAIQYIQSHISVPIQINVLCRYIGVSSSSLYKAFDDIFQISPSVYIKRYKMTLAQNMLSRNERVNDIAHKLGYSSAYHLSKVFKEYVGISPKKYQINLRKN